MKMASVCKRPEIHKEAAIGSRIDSMQIVPTNLSGHQPSQNDANLIQCSLHVHYDDLKISQGSSQGSQNQTAGALRRRKSPRQSCPTKTTSSHVVTSIKDADHVQQKWIESGLMIQHDST